MTKMKTKSDFDSVAEFYDYRAEQKNKRIRELQKEADDYKQKAENEKKFTPELRKEAKEIVGMLRSVNKQVGYIPVEVFDGCVGEDNILALIPPEIVAQVSQKKKTEEKKRGK